MYALKKGYSVISYLHHLFIPVVNLSIACSNLFVLGCAKQQKVFFFNAVPLMEGGGVGKGLNL